MLVAQGGEEEVGVGEVVVEGEDVDARGGLSIRRGIVWACCTFVIPGFVKESCAKGVGGDGNAAGGDVGGRVLCADGADAALVQVAGFQYAEPFAEGTEFREWLVGEVQVCVDARFCYFETLRNELEAPGLEEGFAGDEEMGGEFFRG